MGGGGGGRCELLCYFDVSLYYFFGLYSLLSTKDISLLFVLAGCRHRIGRQGRTNCGSERGDGGMIGKRVCG